MASTVERSRLRRERTFVGSECAVCEEPLEHTLQGERILQFSCSHVSHEACFYEFIRELESQFCPTCDAPLHLDTSRGGNVIDISPLPPPMNGLEPWPLTRELDKISNMMRSASSDARSTSTPTPTWDNQTMRPPSVDSSQRNYLHSQHSGGNARDGSARGGYRESRDTTLSDRYGSSRHARSDSEATGAASSVYPETTQSGQQWRHDYDVQAMESAPGSPRPISRNPVPPPTVTVRSEFPTINRSRQQQTLTCLVTIEVPGNKWRPDPEDIGAPSMQPPPVSARIDEVATRSVMTPASSRFYPYESAEVLEDMTESLRNRVDNWHGLDFGR